MGNNLSDDTSTLIFKKRSHIGLFVCFPIDALPSALTGGEGFQE